MYKFGYNLFYKIYREAFIEGYETGVVHNSTYTEEGIEDSFKALIKRYFG